MSLWSLAALAVVAAAQAAEVTGEVRRADTGAPVAGARLFVDGQEVPARSGPDGRFALTVPDGRAVTVRARAEGFRPAEVRFTPPLAAPLVLSMVPAVAEMEFVIEGERESPHASRQILDRERVERTPGTYGDPIRLIGSLPGAVVTREYSPAAGEILLRGAGPGESRIYLDGVEIPYLYHFQQYASVIHTRLLEEVAVYPSAFGSAYGDATGGVVAVTTRQADSRKVHGAAEANLVIAGGLVTTPAGDGGALSMSGRRSFADLLESSNDQYTLWPVFWDYLGRYDRELSPDHRLWLTGLGAGDSYGRYAGDAAVLDPLEQEDNPAFTFGRRFHGVMLGDELVLGGAETSARAQSVVAFVDDRLEGALPSASAVRTERYGWLRQNTVVELPGRWGLDLGAEAKLAGIDRAVETDRAWIDVAAEAPLLARGVSLDEQVTRFTGGLWAEPRLRLGADTVVQAGGRLQWDSLVQGLPVSVDPRVTVQSRPGGGSALGLRAALGRYTQNPDADDLSAAAGDPTLPMARSEHVAAGVDLRPLDVIELSVDGWGKRLQDVVLTEPGEAPRAEDGWAAGGEVTARLRVREVFFTWASLTMSRARRGDAVFAYDQPYAVNVVGSWQINPRWDVGLRYRDAAGLPYTPVVSSIYDGTTDSYLPVSGDVNSERLPTYRKVDLHVGWTLEMRRITLDLYAEGWYVLPGGNALYPVYNFDYSEQALVVGPSFVPLVGGRAEF